VRRRLHCPQECMGAKPRPEPSKDASKRASSAATVLTPASGAGAAHASTMQQAAAASQGAAVAPEPDAAAAAQEAASEPDVAQAASYARASPQLQRYLEEQQQFAAQVCGCERVRASVQRVGSAQAAKVHRVQALSENHDCVDGRSVARKRAALRAHRERSAPVLSPDAAQAAAAAHAHAHAHGLAQAGAGDDGGAIGVEPVPGQAPVSADAIGALEQAPLLPAAAGEAPQRSGQAGGDAPVAPARRVRGGKEADEGVAAEPEQDGSAAGNPASGKGKPARGRMQAIAEDAAPGEPGEKQAVATAAADDAADAARDSGDATGGSARGGRGAGNGGGDARLAAEKEDGGKAAPGAAPGGVRAGKGGERERPSKPEDDGAGQGPGSSAGKAEELGARGSTDDAEDAPASSMEGVQRGPGGKGKDGGDAPEGVAKNGSPPAAPSGEGKDVQGPCGRDGQGPAAPDEARSRQGGAPPGVACDKRMTAPVTPPGVQARLRQHCARGRAPRHHAVCATSAMQCKSAHATHLSKPHLRKAATRQGAWRDSGACAASCADTEFQLASSRMMSARSASGPRRWVAASLRWTRRRRPW